MFFAARDVGEAMRMEQAQPGIRNGPSVAVKFSIVDCDLQAFFKAFFCFLAIVQCFPSSLNETSKRRCQRRGCCLLSGSWHPVVVWLRGKAVSSGKQSCAHAKACKTEASSWYGLAVETCLRTL